MKYTPAQCRAAFYQAAANIEARPEEYDYYDYRVRRDCPACMWGHVGRVIGMRPHALVDDVADLFGCDEKDLYRTKRYGEDIALPSVAPVVMRRFADKRWPQHASSGQSFPELMASLQNADASGVTS